MLVLKLVDTLLVYLLELLSDCLYSHAFFKDFTRSSKYASSSCFSVYFFLKSASRLVNSASIIADVFLVLVVSD